MLIKKWFGIYLYFEIILNDYFIFLFQFNLNIIQTGMIMWLNYFYKTLT